MTASRLFRVKRLSETYWFLPAVMTLTAVGLAIVLSAFDRTMQEGAPAWLSWAYGGGADGARALLSAVAGSVITVVSVTFSVLVVALTVSSQHFGPRLLRTFMRDRPAQLVLGTFMGTFAYCLMVLRNVQGTGDRFSFFVPHLGIAGAIGLTLVSVGALIYYVHHVAISMQVAEITKRLALELEETIDRLYPEPVGEEPEAPPERPPPVRADAYPVTANDSGYVQHVDGDAVLELAVRHDVMIWITAPPGHFVVAGDALAYLYPRGGNDPSQEMRSALIIGTDRTPQQDPAFGVQQLVEVALRALSPSTNEPFTAVAAIDRLSQGLARLLSRKIPSAVRVDSAGRPRVVTPPPTFGALLKDGLDPIAIHAGRTPAVVICLLERLRGLARVVRRQEDRKAVQGMAERVFSLATQELQEDYRDQARSLLTDITHTIANARRRTAARRSS